MSRRKVWAKPETEPVLPPPSASQQIPPSPSPSPALQSTAVPAPSTAGTVDKHAEYLALLAERNRILRRLEEKNKKKGEVQQERGFSVYFRGANAGAQGKKGGAAFRNTDHPKHQRRQWDKDSGVMIKGADEDYVEDFEEYQDDSPLIVAGRSASNPSASSAADQDGQSRLPIRMDMTGATVAIGLRSEEEKLPPAPRTADTGGTTTDREKDKKRMPVYMQRVQTPAAGGSPVGMEDETEEYSELDDESTILPFREDVSKQDDSMLVPRAESAARNLPIGQPARILSARPQQQASVKEENDAHGVKETTKTTREDDIPVLRLSPQPSLEEREEGQEEEEEEILIDNEGDVLEKVNVRDSMAFVNALRQRIKGLDLDHRLAILEYINGIPGGAPPAGAAAPFRSAGSGSTAGKGSTQERAEPDAKQTSRPTAPSFPLPTTQSEAAPSAAAAPRVLPTVVPALVMDRLHTLPQEPEDSVLYDSPSTRTSRENEEPVDTKTNLWFEPPDPNLHPSDSPVQRSKDVGSTPATERTRRLRFQESTYDSQESTVDRVHRPLLESSEIYEEEDEVANDSLAMLQKPVGESEDDLRSSLNRRSLQYFALYSTLENPPTALPETPPEMEASVSEFSPSSPGMAEVAFDRLFVSILSTHGDPLYCSLLAFDLFDKNGRLIDLSEKKEGSWDDPRQACLVRCAQTRMYKATDRRNIWEERLWGAPCIGFTFVRPQTISVVRLVNEEWWREGSARAIKRVRIVGCSGKDRHVLWEGDVRKEGVEVIVLSEDADIIQKCIRNDPLEHMDDEDPSILPPQPAEPETPVPVKRMPRHRELSSPALTTPATAASAVSDEPVASTMSLTLLSAYSGIYVGFTRVSVYSRGRLLEQGVDYRLDPPASRDINVLYDGQVRDYRVFENLLNNRDSGQTTDERQMWLCPVRWNDQAPQLVFHFFTPTAISQIGIINYNADRTPDDVFRGCEWFKTRFDNGPELIGHCRIGLGYAHEGLEQLIRVPDDLIRSVKDLQRDLVYANMIRVALYASTEQAQVEIDGDKPTCVAKLPHRIAFDFVWDRYAPRRTVRFGTDVSGPAELYADGRLVWSGEIPVTSGTGSKDVSLGARGGTSKESWLPSVDGVPQIVTLYNNGHRVQG